MFTIRTVKSVMQDVKLSHCVNNKLATVIFIKMSVLWWFPVLLPALAFTCQSSCPSQCFCGSDCSCCTGISSLGCSFSLKTVAKHWKQSDNVLCHPPALFPDKMVSACLADIQESFQHSNKTKKHYSLSLKKEKKSVKSKGQSFKKRILKCLTLKNLYKATQQRCCRSKLGIKSKSSESTSAVQALQKQLLKPFFFFSQSTF